MAIKSNTTTRTSGQKARRLRRPAAKLPATSRSKGCLSYVAESCPGAPGASYDPSKSLILSATPPKRFSLEASVDPASFVCFHKTTARCSMRKLQKILNMLTKAMLERIPKEQWRTYPRFSYDPTPLKISLSVHFPLIDA